MIEVYVLGGARPHIAPSVQGLTMIEVYVFWNLHERVRGRYDFATGRRNLPLFLAKAAQHGLFVYLRPGPYVYVRSSPSACCDPAPSSWCMRVGERCVPRARCWLSQAQRPG